MAMTSGKAFETVRRWVYQRSCLGHQVCCQLAGRRRGAEAMPGKTGGQGQARKTGHRADHRVGVGGDVDGPGPGAGDTCLFEHGPGRLEVAHGFVVECRVGERVLRQAHPRGVPPAAGGLAVKGPWQRTRDVLLFAADGRSPRARLEWVFRGTDCTFHRACP